MRIATFNVQNLRLRTQEGQTLLDAATDDDASEPARSAAIAHADRIETAKVIAAARADVVALQEVFDIETLDFFHNRYLQPAGSTVYNYRYCLKGNDGRGLNVAALSKERANTVRSYADRSGADLGLNDLDQELRDNPIFRRDCLELDFDSVTLFVCHFKAPYPEPKRAFAVRAAEARAARRIIETRFAEPERERWILLGDFNEPYSAREGVESALDVLGDGFAVDLRTRQQPGRAWTYEIKHNHLHTRPDRILVSPALARAYPDARPEVIRFGMDAAHNHKGVTGSEPHARASDHALVFADFPGL